MLFILIGTCAALAIYTGVLHARIRRLYIYQEEDHLMIRALRDKLAHADLRLKTIESLYTARARAAQARRSTNPEKEPEQADPQGAEA